MLPTVVTSPPKLGEVGSHQTASAMARIYQESVAEIIRLMQAIDTQCDILSDTFTPDNASYPSFQISFECDGHRFYHTDRAIEEVPALFKRIAWRRLIDCLGVKQIMSVKTRQEFERKLDGKGEGELPEITEETILSVLGGLYQQAQNFAQEAAKEVFSILRPRGPISGKYATNDAFRVGRRVILCWYVEREWSGKRFRVSYHHEKELTAIDAVFHLLDGLGVLRDSRGPLIRAITDSPDGKGETDFFRFKCYKNRNLHLEMKRLDLVKQLNLLAAGEYVLGADTD